MKKTFTLVSLLIIVSLVNAQPADLPTIIKDTLFTSCGYKVIEGEKLSVGTGTMPDGSFKYIRINSASLMRYTSTNSTPNAANNANAFEPGNAGHKFKIAKVVDRGSKKHGYVYYAIINSGMTRYEVDIENAIMSGEVVVPDEFKKKNVSTVAPASVSVADELTKLKKLYDDGVISKEEFEAQKKKLLNQ